PQDGARCRERDVALRARAELGARERPTEERLRSEDAPRGRGGERGDRILEAASGERPTPRLEVRGGRRAREPPALPEREERRHDPDRGRGGEREREAVASQRARCLLEQAR